MLSRRADGDPAGFDIVVEGHIRLCIDMCMDMCMDMCTDIYTYIELGCMLTGAPRHLGGSGLDGLRGEHGPDPQILAFSLPELVNYNPY